MGPALSLDENIFSFHTPALLACLSSLLFSCQEHRPCLPKLGIPITASLGQCGNLSGEVYRLLWRWPHCWACSTLLPHLFSLSCCTGKDPHLSQDASIAEVSARASPKQPTKCPTYAALSLFAVFSYWYLTLFHTLYIFGQFFLLIIYFNGYKITEAGFFCLYTAISSKAIICERMINECSVASWIHPSDQFLLCAII